LSSSWSSSYSEKVVNIMARECFCRLQQKHINVIMEQTRASLIISLRWGVKQQPMNEFGQKGKTRQDDIRQDKTRQQLCTTFFK
jgi:hypothetical protein